MHLGALTYYEIIMNLSKISSILFLGGFIAAVGDISYAIIFAITQGSSAEHLLQFVATGLLGEGAFQGGWATAGFGLALHFAITFFITFLFYMTSLRISFINRRPIIAGMALGIIVFIVMKFIVLPLSAFPYPINLKPLSTITNLLSHIFFFGIPIAVAVSKANEKYPLH